MSWVAIINQSSNFRETIQKFSKILIKINYFQNSKYRRKWLPAPSSPPSPSSSSPPSVDFAAAAGAASAGTDSVGGS